MLSPPAAFFRLLLGGKLPGALFDGLLVLIGTTGSSSDAGGCCCCCCGCCGGWCEARDAGACSLRLMMLLLLFKTWGGAVVEIGMLFKFWPRLELRNSAWSDNSWLNPKPPQRTSRNSNLQQRYRERDVQLTAAAIILPYGEMAAPFEHCPEVRYCVRHVRFVSLPCPSWSNCMKSKHVSVPLHYYCYYSPVGPSTCSSSFSSSSLSTS